MVYAGTKILLRVKIVNMVILSTARSLQITGIKPPGSSKPVVEVAAGNKL